MLLCCKAFVVSVARIPWDTTFEKLSDFCFDCTYCIPLLTPMRCTIRFVVVFAFPVLLSMGGLAKVSSSLRQTAPKPSPVVSLEIEGSGQHAVVVTTGTKCRSLELENLSQTTTTRLRLSTSALPDLSSFDRILKNVRATSDGTSMSLGKTAWKLVQDYRYAWNSASDTDECHDPVKLLNVYGYGLCDDTARVLVTTWEGVGLAASAWDLGFHSLAEFGDGQTTHMLDADLSLYAPDPVTGVPMSISQVINNPENLQPIPGEPVERSGASLAKLKRLYFERRKKAIIFKRKPITGHEIVFEMRPGERMTRYAESTLGYYAKLNHTPPPRYANAVFDWSLTNESSQWQRVSPAMVSGSRSTTVTQLLIPSSFPFIIVSGNLEFRCVSARQPRMFVEFSRDNVRWVAAETRWRPDANNVHVYRCKFPSALKNSYTVYIRVGQKLAKQSSPAQVVAFDQHVVTQCSPTTFPRLVTDGGETTVSVEMDRSVPLRLTYR